MTEEYQPFGDEWKKEMMKLTKAQLIEFLKVILIRNTRFVISDLPEDFRNCFKNLIRK